MDLIEGCLLLKKRKLQHRGVDGRMLSQRQQVAYILEPFASVLNNPIKCWRLLRSLSEVRLALI